MENFKKEFTKNFKEASKSFWHGFNFAAGVILFIAIFFALQLYYCKKEIENPNSRTNKGIEKELKKFNTEMEKEINKAFTVKPQYQNYNTKPNPIKKNEPKKINPEERERQIAEEIKARENLQKENNYMKNNYKKTKKGIIEIKESK